MQKRTKEQDNQSVLDSTGVWNIPLLPGIREGGKRRNGNVLNKSENITIRSFFNGK